MIRPFVLRRLKRDVLKELPDKLEKCIYAKLEGEQQKLYDAHVKRMKLMLEKQSDEEFKTSKIQILSELTKLRQICCNPALLFDKNVVMVYKLIVKGTIEENIMKLQEKKRELADQILSGDGMGSGSFSREELLELL